MPNKINEKLFQEAKNCFSINAYTASVLCCREFIINYVESCGSMTNVSFISSLDYLLKNNFVPSNINELINNIKVKQYERIKKIDICTKEEAEEIILFIDILLKFNSEFEAGSNKNNWQFLYRILESNQEDLKRIIECKDIDAFKNIFEELLRKSGISIFGLNNRTFYPYQIYGDKYSKYPDTVSQYEIYLANEEGDTQITEIENLIINIVKDVVLFDDSGPKSINDLDNIIPIDEISEDLWPNSISDIDEKLSLNEPIKKKKFKLSNLLENTSSKSNSFSKKYAIVSSKTINIKSNSLIEKIVGEYEIELISIPKFYSIEGL